MSVTNILKTDTFDTFRIKTNTISSELGDNALLVANPTLSATNAVDAVLETLIKVETEVGVIGALTTTAETLVGAINEHDAELGVISTLTTTQKGTIVGSINELDAEMGVLSTLTTTQKGTIVGSINELDADIGSLIEVLDVDGETVIHPGLSTTYKTNLVGSINEIVQRETDRYNNTLKLDLGDATVGGTNASTQTIKSNVSLTSGHTLTVPGTLDISNGTLIVGGTGGNLNIQTTYLTLGNAQSPTAVSGGIKISRGSVIDSTDPDNPTYEPREDVQVYWDESVKKWILKKFDDDGTGVVRPWIIDSYNAKDLIASNTESGIDVTWDADNSNFDFNVNDFTITLAGDLSGSVTITDLASATLTATIVADATELGVDTTGAYVKSIALATTTPGISMTQSAAGAESNVITVLKVDSTVIRDFGAQTIAGVKTFSNTPKFDSGFTSSAASSVAGTLTVSSGGVEVTGNSTFKDNVTITGNLTVDGSLTTINSTTVSVDDKNIELGAITSKTGLEATLTTGTAAITLTTGTTAGMIVGQALTKTSGAGAFGTTPTIASITGSTTLTASINHATAGAIVFSTGGTTNATANGGGITLKGTSDKTITWDSTNSNWTSSENWNLNSTSQVFKIANSEVLSAGTTNKLFQLPVVSHVPTNNTGTFNRTNNVTTVATTTAHGLSVGQTIDIIDGAGSSFSGLGKVIATVPNTTAFTYADPGSNATQAGVLFAKNSGNGAVVVRNADGSLVANYIRAGQINSAIWNGKTIGIAYGGTNITSYTKGDILYASDTNVLSKLAKGTDGQVLKLTNGLPAWGTDIDTNTNTTYSQSAESATDGAILRLTAGGSGSGNDDIKLKSDTGIAVSRVDADNIKFTIVTEDVQDIVGAMFDPTPAPNTQIENGISVYYEDSTGKINADVNDFTITISGAVKSTDKLNNGECNNLGNVTIETEIDTNSTQFKNAVQALLPKIYNVSGTQIFP